MTVAGDVIDFSKLLQVMSLPVANCVQSQSRWRRRLLGRVVVMVLEHEENNFLLVFLKMTLCGKEKVDHVVSGVWGVGRTWWRES